METLQSFSRMFLSKDCLKHMITNEQIRDFAPPHKENKVVPASGEFDAQILCAPFMAVTRMPSEWRIYHGYKNTHRKIESS